MKTKEVFYTNEAGVRKWESGEVFNAHFTENFGNNIPFKVSSEYVVERNDSYVVIDTANDADL